MIVRVTSQPRWVENTVETAKDRLCMEIVTQITYEVMRDLRRYLGSKVFCASENQFRALVKGAT